MNIDNLPDNPEELKKIILDFYQHISLLEQKMAIFQKALFGSSSEKFKTTEKDQLTLPFLKSIDDINNQNDFTEENQQEVTVQITKRRKKKGRRRLPVNFPRIEEFIDIPEEEKICECGTLLTRIGEDVSEKIDYIPATIRILRIIRPKYACRKCEGVETSTKTVKIAPPPKQLIPKGIATASLLAHIIISKFADALPFYRQHLQFLRLGVEIPRSTMAAWAIYVANRCQPLVDLLVEDIRSGPLINMDETPLQVLKEPGKKNTTKSYMWIFIGGDPQRPSVVFQYDPSRSKDVPARLVGSDYRGYIQTDGYAGYDSLGTREGIEHLGCLVHARRKFFDVIKPLKKRKGAKIKGSTAQTVLNRIRDLYKLEKLAKEQEMSPEQIRDLRQEKAIPILDEIKILLDERISTTPPKSLLHTAISYALGQWDRLTRYTEDGILHPDNNLAENAIRPLAVGRKNWLFAGSPKGARASAIYFSLIETAKANGLEPHAYIRHLFEMIPMAETKEDLKRLLPKNFTRETLPLYS
jgi:transposase